MRMALAVDNHAKKTKGKMALAIEAYARALRQIPTIIADNGGYDAADLIQDLKVEVAAGNDTAGLDMTCGMVGNMSDLGVVECLRAKECSLISASEACEMILRVDDIVKCAPR